MTDELEHPSEIDETEQIVLDPRFMCEEHMNEAGDWGIPAINMFAATQGALLENEKFYEIAYRIKNGYGIPEYIDTNDIPEGEQPGVKHINDTLKEIQPICCWLVNNTEDPWPEQEGSSFIHIMADYVEREMNKEKDE